MDIETKVKTALLIRGFDNEKMLNNRGLIGTTIADNTASAPIGDHIQDYYMKWASLQA